MSVTFTDHEIAVLLHEQKPLPLDWPARVQLRPKRGHKERQLMVTGRTGNEFRMILRQSRLNALNFSVILAVRVPNSNRLFRLQRCNGKSHKHSNHIEGTSFYDFHIHMATERYQVKGFDEDEYAEVTDRYSDLAGALNCILSDGHFDIPPGSQMGLL